MATQLRRDPLGYQEGQAQSKRIKVGIYFQTHFLSFFACLPIDFISSECYYAWDKL